MKQKIIIDCDPGIDDALALLYALQHKDLEVVAITITEGNVPVELGMKNAFKILELTHRTEIPVYVGTNFPLKREFVSAQDTHGFDGLGESNLTISSNLTAQSEPASDFLARIFTEKTDISLIALGPLTNIARALQKNAALGQNLSRFVSMGGSYKSHGNCSPVAEYNYWCDPDAAQFVYAHLGKTIEMVGLDVTRKIVLTPNLLEYMSKINPEVANFVAKITRFYFDFHWQYEHLIGCVINDPLAVAYFADATICPDFIESYVDIVTEGIALGQTIIDDHDFYKKPSNSKILTQTQPIKFYEDFLSVILHTEKSIIAKDLAELK